MDAEAYLLIEQELTDVVNSAWAPAASATFAGVAAAVHAKDFGEAYELLTKLEITIERPSTLRTLRGLLAEAAFFGAGTFGTPEFKLDTKFLDAVARRFSRSLSFNLTEGLYDRGLQLIAEAERGEGMLGEGGKNPSRYVRALTSFKDAGFNKSQMISSLHSSRLAVYGFTAEADVRGVTEYQLWATLDGRTSDFCTLVHGKTFKVEHARSKIMEALNAESDEALRVIQPWPKQDPESLERYATLTPDQLTAMGYHIPPFHPRCRTLCRVKSVS